MGLMLGTRRSLFGGGGVPTWNFDASAVTFTAKMAKRTAPGPFAAAPIVQGKWDSTGTPDALTYEDGSQISDYFYANLDQYQGTFVLWITPEWNGDDNLWHHIWSTSATNYFRKTTDNTLALSVNGDQHPEVDISGWIAGTTYCIVARWDKNNTLDGTNYLCLSINGAHTFGKDSATAPSATAPTIYVGSLNNGSLGADAIIEGFTVYRRPLFDGTYPAALVNLSDEILNIYAGGAGKKPEEETGADDICFQLPTDGSTGELATGTGEAWSMAWDSEELLNWHMQEETGGAPDDWTAINAPTLADAATADILFGTRSQKISVNAALEGIRGDTTPTAGQDKVVFAWLKADGANKGVDLRIYDADGTADIVEMTTDAALYTQFNTCYEVPAGCSNVQHFIESTDADTYDIHLAQLQVLANLWDDGGFETGTAITGVGTPTTSAQSAEQAHSGTNSWKIVADATDEGFKRTITTTSGKYYMVTAWVYAVTAGTVDLIAGGTTVTSSGADAWKKLTLVMLADAATEDVTIQSNAAQTYYVDDVSVVVLTDVSLTATAANAANSAEDSGIRVDGLDGCYDDTTVSLGATSGKIRFNWIPRHGDGDFIKFYQAASVTAFIMMKDTNNYIQLYTDDNDNLTLNLNIASGGSETDDWNASGLTVGTTYLVEIEYNATQCTCSFDGTVRMTVAYTGGIDFGANIPDTAYIGTSHASQRQFDAVYKAP